MIERRIVNAMSEITDKMRADREAAIAKLDAGPTSDGTHPSINFMNDMIRSNREALFALDARLDRLEGSGKIGG